MFTRRVTGSMQIDILNLLTSIHGSCRIYPTLWCNVIHRFIFQTIGSKVFHSKTILCFGISRLRIEIIKESVGAFSPVIISSLIGILKVVNLKISINVFYLNLVFNVVFFQPVFQILKENHRVLLTLNIQILKVFFVGILIFTQGNNIVYGCFEIMQITSRLRDWLEVVKSFVFNGVY